MNMLGSSSHYHAPDCDCTKCHPKVDYSRLSESAKAIVTGEAAAASRILDWIGVAGGLPLSERVRLLAVELATKQGYSLDEANRLSHAALAEPDISKEPNG